MKWRFAIFMDPTIVGAEGEKIFAFETVYILGNGLFEYLKSSK